MANPHLRIINPIANKTKGSASRVRGKRSASRRNAAQSKETHRPPIVKYSPNVFGFPQRLMTKLRYCDTFPITSTLGAQGLQSYRWNSTFDPDMTGTGHQPLYRDTYAGIYDHYAVVRARATVRILNAVTTVPFLVGIVTDDDGTPSASANTISEMSTAQTRLISPLSGSMSNVTLTATWDCVKVLGIDPYTSQTYKTAVGSNPTEDSTLSIFCYTTDGSTNSIVFQIVLEQDVLWTELTTPTGS